MPDVSSLLLACSYCFQLVVMGVIWWRNPQSLKTPTRKLYLHLCILQSLTRLLWLGLSSSASGPSVGLWLIKSLGSFFFLSSCVLIVSFWKSTLVYLDHRSGEASNRRSRGGNLRSLVRVRRKNRRALTEPWQQLFFKPAVILLAVYNFTMFSLYWSHVSFMWTLWTCVLDGTLRGVAHMIVSAGFIWYGASLASYIKSLKGGGNYSTFGRPSELSRNPSFVFGNSPIQEALSSPNDSAAFSSSSSSSSSSSMPPPPPQPSSSPLGSSTLPQPSRIVSSPSSLSPSSLTTPPLGASLVSLSGFLSDAEGRAEGRACLTAFNSSILPSGGSSGCSDSDATPGTAATGEARARTSSGSGGSRGGRRARRVARCSFSGADAPHHHRPLSCTSGADCATPLLAPGGGGGSVGKGGRKRNSQNIVRVALVAAASLLVKACVDCMLVVGALQAASTAQQVLPAPRSNESWAEGQDGGGQLDEQVGVGLAGDLLFCLPEVLCSVVIAVTISKSKAKASAPPAP